MFRLFLLIGLGVCFTVQAGTSIEVPDSIKAKYKYLYDQKVKSLPDGTFAFDKGRLSLREGIRVLYLHGDSFEMAYQHGRLLRDEILQGALPKTSELVRTVIANALGDRPVLINLVDFGVQLLVTDPIIRLMLKDSSADVAPLLAQAYALSESTGIPAKTIVEALIAPDLYMWLAALTSRNENAAIPSVSNCSDFAAWGKYTGGSMVIGRNLDYPLNGYYDRFPTIIYFDPTEAGAQRYLAVVSAGVHNAGLTAINASGIFIGAHTIPTTDVGKDGKPVFAIANEVIRLARSFDEAVALFKRYPPLTGYTYTLISARERRAAGIEMSNSHRGIRESKADMHVQSNHFMTDNMKPYNLAINQSIEEDSAGRYERIRGIIQEGGARVDERVAMKILGDQYDPFHHQWRGHGNTVAVHTTMTSAVVLPDQNRIYVANGRAPASQGQYVSFPLFEGFDPASSLSQPYEVIDNSSFKWEHREMAIAEQQFIEAKKAYEYQNDPARALAIMRMAVNTDDSNPNYWFMTGILALKIGERDEARAAFRRILSIGTIPHEQRLAHYYLGRILAEEGNRSEAIEEFTKIVDDNNSDPKLSAAAEVAIRRTGSVFKYPIRPLELNLLMQFADMQGY